MPRPTTLQPPAPEWTESEYLVRNDFERLAARRVELRIQQDAIDAELKDLNLELGAMLATANVNSVRFGFYRLALGHSTKGGRLSKERLLELGVTVDQIERATSPKEVGDSYVTITEIKQGDPTE